MATSVCIYKLIFTNLHRSLRVFAVITSQTANICRKIVLRSKAAMSVQHQTPLNCGQPFSHDLHKLQSTTDCVKLNATTRQPPIFKKLILAASLLFIICRFVSLMADPETKVHGTFCAILYDLYNPMPDRAGSVCFMKYK